MSDLEKRLQTANPKDTLLGLVKILLQHNKSINIIWNLIPETKLEQMWSYFSENFYRSILPDIDELLVVANDILLSTKHFQVLQSLFCGEFPLLPPVHEFKEHQRLWSMVTLKILKAEAIFHNNKPTGCVISILEAVKLIIFIIQKYSILKNFCVSNAPYLALVLLCSVGKKQKMAEQLQIRKK